LFGNRFMSIAERMGAVLERTSHSTNIKERLDFSCALFDGEGRLVANAPHIPVHLGAMGESVRAVVASRAGDLRDGDVIVTNDPYHGGSHLPDVTAVSPVLVRDGQARFFVANRAHHADVGGITPGSMPPGSKTIEEEGARVHNLLLVRDGHVDEAAVRHAFTSCRYPARALEQRMSDFRAQAAANAEGARLLHELCETHGAVTVSAFMGHVLDDGAAAMEELIAVLPPGRHVMEDALDDGTRLQVAIWREGERVVVDFAGTGPRSPGNHNAPRAVTRAAVLYALRTLMGREIPLNEGCLRPVEIRIPPGSLLDPVPPHAVVGGNVETSMRLVDLVLGALRACAASQGTMNNVTFGTRDLAYYETLGGGAGAGPDFSGASAVHLHMTNTRITDVEVMERRYPVVIRRFAVRHGSGGAGRHRGGDGLIREIEFLAAVDGGILSERRAAGAFGLEGGLPGLPGRNVLSRDGVETELPGRAAFTAGPGDVLRVETPGGGGYGSPE
jgi:5-oxoprolinase (ATP-hydrolysing)